MMKKELKEVAFEDALQRLEQVVELLEKGEAPLEEAIELFDEGMKLVNVCGQKLERAEQRVEMLIEENDQWVKKSFTIEEDLS